MNFCRDTVLPINTMSFKDVLNRKKRAFRDGDREELMQAQKELKVHLQEAKESYSRKVEQELQQNNLKEVWEGMKTITGCKKREQTKQREQTSLTTSSTGLIVLLMCLQTTLLPYQPPQHPSPAVRERKEKTTAPPSPPP